MTQARDALDAKIETLRAERKTVEARIENNGLRYDPRLDRQRIRRLTAEIETLKGNLAELDQLALVGDGTPRQIGDAFVVRLRPNTSELEANFDDAA